MNPAQVLDDEEWEEYLKELAGEKKLHPEKFFPDSGANGEIKK